MRRLSHSYVLAAARSLRGAPLTSAPAISAPLTSAPAINAPLTRQHHPFNSPLPGSAAVSEKPLSPWSFVRSFQPVPQPAHAMKPSPFLLTSQAQALCGTLPTYGLPRQPAPRPHPHALPALPRVVSLLPSQVPPQGPADISSDSARRQKILESASSASSFHLARLSGIHKQSTLPDRRKIRGLRPICCTPCALSAQATNGSTEASDKGPKVVLTNTMTGKKEALKLINEGKVGMYVCGVTVYDFSHIGHARVYVSFDAIYRYLLSLGLNVTYVRNFTDVDDKILKRAAENGEDPLALSARFIREFHADMEQLGCLPPTHEPKVSDHIPDIVSMIATIIEKGHAYAVEGGDVFFSVPSSPAYGQLSGRKQEENRAGERVDIDPRKQNPADFALWKAAKPGESVTWDSPWGPGRPGWHIECSAMSARYLGYQFDIHGGGQDLVFPHHENELAQSRAACPECQVSSWVHNGFVNIDSEKMSKSLGNFFTIREVLQQYHPMALRWFLLSTHYRSPINFSQRQLAVASDRVFYVYQILSSAHTILAESSGEESPQGGTPNQADATGEGSIVPSKGEGPKRDSKGDPKGGPKVLKPSKAAQAAADKLRKEAWASLADDFHTGEALAALSEPLKLMSEAATPRKKKAPIDTASIGLLLDSVVPLLQVLGFSTDQAACDKVLDELRQLALLRAGLSEAELAARMAERADARVAKDFARSDVIREELAAKGVLLMDGPTGQSWCPSAAVGLEEEGSPKEGAHKEALKVNA